MSQSFQTRRRRRRRQKKKRRVTAVSWCPAGLQYIATVL
jgi:hypothetical protein